ncbi:hypothetical protein ABZP36_001906 [Zizania latifolia]
MATRCFEMTSAKCFACFQGGPSWRVPPGQRDGTVSSMQEALAEIPSPTMSFPELAGLFAGKGLAGHDLVWLSEGHSAETVGIISERRKPVLTPSAVGRAPCAVVHVGEEMAHLGRRAARPDLVVVCLVSNGKSREEHGEHGGTENGERRRR